MQAKPHLGRQKNVDPSHNGTAFRNMRPFLANAHPSKINERNQQNIIVGTRESRMRLAWGTPRTASKKSSHQSASLPTPAQRPFLRSSHNQIKNARSTQSPPHSHPVTPLPPNHPAAEPATNLETAEVDRSVPVVAPAPPAGGRRAQRKQTESCGGKYGLSRLFSRPRTACSSVDNEKEGHSCNFTTRQPAPSMNDTSQAVGRARATGVSLLATLKAQPSERPQPTPNLGDAWQNWLGHWR